MQIFDWLAKQITKTILTRWMIIWIIVVLIGALSISP
jgi:hypothetical protein